MRSTRHTDSKPSEDVATTLGDKASRDSRQRRPSAEAVGGAVVGGVAGGLAFGPFGAIAGMVIGAVTAIATTRRFAAHAH